VQSHKYEIQQSAFSDEIFPPLPYSSGFADVSEVLPTGLEFVPLLDSEGELASSVSTCVRVALAVTGKEYALIAEHLPQELRRLAVCGTVFARMSPDQKTQLVHSMQELVGLLCSSAIKMHFK
jgi:hypothetical protein